MNTIKVAAITLLYFYSALCAAQSRSYSDFEITELNTKYLVSSERSSIAGRTDLKFRMQKAGQLFFHFNGQISNAALDGKSLSGSQLTREIPKGSRSSVYVLQPKMDAGEVHTLSLQYKVDSSQFRVKEFDGKPVMTFGTRYENAEGVGPEAIMPSLNRPSSDPKLTVEIGFSSTDEAKLHKPVCHCQMSQMNNGYKFDFSNTPTLQAFFGIAPVSANQPIRKIEVNDIQVTIILSADGFSSSEEQRASAFNQATNVIRQTIPKMESLFGKYKHGSELTVFLFEPHGTSMEYRGAVQSRPELLRHELIHQWFATALSPVEYRDIWLNEAITVWLRKELFNEDETWNGTVPVLTEQSEPFNLAAAPALFEGYSPDVYTHGFAFLNLADQILKRESSGTVTLLPILQDFYKQNAGKHISARTFIQHLDANSKYRWEPLFKKLIYGQQ